MPGVAFSGNARTFTRSLPKYWNQTCSRANLTASGRSSGTKPPPITKSTTWRGTTRFLPLFPFRILSPPLALVSPRLFRNSQGGDALPNPLRGRGLVWLFLTTPVYDCPVLLLSTPLSGRSGWSTQPRGNPNPDFLEFPYLFSRDLYNFRHKPHSLKYSPSCFDFA